MAKKLPTILAVVGMVLISREATGQNCNGSPSLAKSRTQITIGAQRNTDQKAIGGALQVSTSRVFVVANALQVDVPNETTKMLQVGASTGVSVAAGPIGMCPFVGFSFNTPMKFQTIANQDAQVASRNLGMGASVGWTINVQSGVQVIPTATISYGPIFNRMLIEGRNRLNWTDWDGIVSSGFGLVFNDRISVIPSISKPFRSTNQDLQYGLQVVLGIMNHQ